MKFFKLNGVELGWVSFFKEGYKLVPRNGGKSTKQLVLALRKADHQVGLSILVIPVAKS